MTRTHDLLITNQLHYRLCYTSDLYIIIFFGSFVKSFLKNSVVGDARDAIFVAFEKAPQNFYYKFGLGDTHSYFLYYPVGRGLAPALRYSFVYSIKSVISQSNASQNLFKI